jgi:hypothetical protein
VPCTQAAGRSAGGRPVPKIGNANRKVISLLLEHDVHAAIFADRSRMLNGVGDQFVHDQGERGRHLSGDSERVGVDDKRPRSIGAARCGRDRLTKIAEVTISSRFAFSSSRRSFRSRSDSSSSNSRGPISQRPASLSSNSIRASPSCSRSRPPHRLQRQFLGALMSNSAPNG